MLIGIIIVTLCNSSASAINIIYNLFGRMDMLLGVGVYILAREGSSLLSL
mgnify:CR=1 FL=1